MKLAEEIGIVEQKKCSPTTVHLPKVALPQAIAVPEPETMKAPGQDGFFCDPNFIHGRHTCDGCLTTPIFGLRYHAVDLPDYDLCSRCYQNHTGKDIAFKPVELDRDRHLQTRWKRRYRTKCHASVKPHSSFHQVSNKKMTIAQIASGTQTRKVIEGLSDDLKEAIRLSMIDALKHEESLTKEKTADNTEVVGEKNMKDDVAVVPTAEIVSPIEVDVPVAASESTKDEKNVIPTAPVVDIEAGNEETAKALKDMDPKVKEALRKKLNVFFQRRACSKKGADVESDLMLSSNFETQKKIDAMDPHTKEAISRSLNEFFASRRAPKEEQAEKEQKLDETEEKDDLKRTGEILNNIDKEEDLPSVIVDVVLDNDLSVGTNDDIHVDTEAGIEESDSGISDGTMTKEDWQIVSEDDEMIAVAAQMLGSALFESSSSIQSDSIHKEK